MRSRRGVTSACSPGEQLLDLEPQRGAGRTLEHRADFRHVEAPDAPAVHFEQLVSDDQPRLVGGKSLVGLRDRDPVAALAHEGTDSSVFAGGEYLELLHLVLGYQDGVRVEIRGHSGGRVPKHFVRVDRIDVKRAHVAEHVEQNLYVAPEREIGLRCGRERSRRDQRRGGDQCVADGFRYIFHVFRLLDDV